MDKKDIIVKNFHLGTWDDFDCPEEAVLCFNSLINNPCQGLVDQYKIKSKVEYSALLLPHISKLFKIDRNKLREEWVSLYFYYECFGDK